MTLDELRFDAQGLLPAVVQEADTGELLMVAWMDRAAVLESALSGGLSSPAAAMPRRREARTKTAMCGPRRCCRGKAQRRSIS